MASKLQSTIFLGHDVFPRGHTENPDIETCKRLALLHDRLLVDLWSYRQRKEPFVQALAKQDLVIPEEFSISLENSLSRLNDGPKRVEKSLRSLFAPLPAVYNTSLNREAFRAVEYGATSGLIGMSELDYLISTSLHTVRHARTREPNFPKGEFHNALQAGWLWLTEGITSATNSPYLLEALHYFIQSDKRIDFKNENKTLKQILKEARQWNLDIDKQLPNRLEDTPSTIVDIIIPKFENLSWEQIFYLKSRKDYKYFRQWFCGFLQNMKNETSLNYIDRQISEMLFKLAREVEPRPGETIIRGMVGELASRLFPIIPFGLIQTFSEWRAERDRLANQGHVFWLAHARYVASSSSPAPEGTNG